MSVALVTGSLGLIGSEAALHFGRMGMDVIGVDNDMRAYFFGPGHTTAPNRERLESRLGTAYTHIHADIRSEALTRVIRRYKGEIDVVIHTAAQPSHDWAVREPMTDFGVNATGTLHLLEAVREYAPDAVFIFTSTNKVYGDTPNSLPLVEGATRLELLDHPFSEGITEEMSIDSSLHSLFGVSKTAADLLVQEYGRYFGMKTVCFRGGTLTGPQHAAAQLHGFLAYLMRCTATGTPYTVFGYKGKQVRDVIHSADVVSAFEAFYRNPKAGVVYNLGGGLHSNCSVLEAIELCQEISGRELQWSYRDEARIGDHKWWVSSLSKFQRDYPSWQPQYTLRDIASGIYEACHETESTLA